MSEKLPELLTVNEVLEALRISRATLERLIRSGDIKYLQQTEGGHRKFRKDDILLYLASQLGN